MKKWGKVTILLLVLCVAAVCVGLFSACAETTYTVVYNTMGGDELPDGTYRESDESFYLPTPRPGDKYGYKFAGWYYDEACTESVERESADAPLLDVSRAQDGVITLYAAWSDLYTISFDSRTGEVFDSLQYHYMDVVQTSSLPVPQSFERGGVTCTFLYWVDVASGNALTGESFRMDSTDMFLQAQYDTGVDDQFDLTDSGYVSNLQSGQVANTAWTRDTLEDGEALSVSVTFPANYSAYNQDSGIVFSAESYSAGGNSFTNAIFFYISSTVDNDASLGGLQFWGTKTVDGVDTEAAELARYGIDGAELRGTAYAEKIAAYKAGGEEETFVYTVRRSGNRWYVGVDGVEYVSIAIGDAAAGGGTVSAALTGSVVGLRAKCTDIYYSDLKIESADNIRLLFDAGENASLSETDSERTVDYGNEVGELPVPVHAEGWTFVGWQYTVNGETFLLEETDSFDSESWKIHLTAVWDDPGAAHYDIVFDTGLETYTFAPVTDWFAGKALSFPALGTYTFHTFDGNWYYDAGFTKVAEAGSFDPAQATVAADGKTITLYAKYDTQQFTNTGWSSAEGSFSGPGDTFVSTYSFGAGQTLTVDVTLPPYTTTYGAVSIFFGSDEGSNTGFRLLVLGTTESNADVRGAVQLNRWVDGKLIFIDSAYSVRRYLGALAGSSYQTGYEAYMESGEPFTFTMGVIADEDCFHCTINGIVIWTFNAPPEGSCIGFSNITANTGTFSNVTIVQNTASVTFDAAEGTLSGDTQFTLQSGETLGSLFAGGELPVPEREGYSFIGWFNGSVQVSADDTFSGTVKSVTLTAHWAREGAQTVVSFDANGGEVSEEERALGAGAALTGLPVPTRSGYTFTGWYYEHERVYEGYVFPLEAETAALRAAWMSDSVWDGTAAEAYAGGTGTESDPYRIETGAQLAYFAAQVNGGNDYAGAYFTLVNGIDLGSEAWTPVGTDAHPFCGVFDGNDNKVDNIVTSGANYVGFFGAVKNGAVVQNLTVDIRTNGTQFVGGIAGGTDQEVHIRNCEVYGTVSATGNFVGGVVGLLRIPDEATVENCKVFADVVTNGGSVGGVVGCNRATVINCYVSADATVKGTAASELPLVGSSPNVGAITGENQTNGENIGTATDCGLCDANGKPAA